MVLLTVSTQLLTREANRRNLAYQGHAIGCLAKIASFPNAIDLHEEALSVVDAAITEHDLADAKGGSDRMDVDPGSGKRVDAASAAEGYVYFFLDPDIDLQLRLFQHPGWRCRCSWGAHVA